MGFDFLKYIKSKQNFAILKKNPDPEIVYSYFQGLGIRGNIY
jgi:hypothetical protein